MAQEKASPRIVEVPEMPSPRVGRPGADLEPLARALEDRNPHALEGISTEDEKRRWRRRLRRAARRAEMRVETRYIAPEARLYFRGTDDIDGKR
jgi:hypothetical protein